jgi:DNA-binding MurR/RpiR family transcriptional regulator
MIEKELQNLSMVFEKISSDESVIRAATLTVSARRRFIIGHGKSLAYATLLSKDLSASLSQVTLIDEVAVSALDVLAGVREGDLLLAFSFRRYRRETLQIATQFVETGGTLLVLTDSIDSPIAAMAAEVVVVSTDSASYADSPTAVAAVVHLLSTLTTASSKGARRRLADRDRLSSVLNLYVDVADDARNDRGGDA